MELRNSLLRLEEPSICPCPEPDQFSRCPNHLSEEQLASATQSVGMS
jgi:hypothetical protein